ncbi:putative disease resistance protein RGA1 [Panicum miliaceum]|uniref:Disease resistance protein RGA1 n=1 Tax=Panicum miliaceum TaxID=4540 RepID=A0A3L6QHW3_PANMI|nr:putative disease resistance protein RGA1 [Panicum miliaceum]
MSPSSPQSLSNLDACSNRSAIPNFRSSYSGSDRIFLLHNLGAIGATRSYSRPQGPDPARGRDAVCYNPGLQGLLEDLSKKADEAEDALDELPYFMIQDELDGTREAASEVGGGLSGHARRGRHAVGNWLPCFSCSRTQDNAYNKDNNGRVGALQFDRVAMAKRIKSLIKDIQTSCAPVPNLLHINHSSYPTATKQAASLKRPNTSSTITQDKLYGRGTIFEQTVHDMASGAYRSEVLSVLAVVGPGGIGKTTFTQHLCNDKRIEEQFPVRVWVCVSTNFDVVKLTQEILKSILAVENEESSRANETTNLDQLQKSVAQRLKSKRFLVVLDDIWKCNSESEWKNLLSPFTKGEAKGHMVLVTTRFPNIAQVIKTTNPIKLQGLEPGEFWEFFQACIFGDTDVELEQHDLIGKRDCKEIEVFPTSCKNGITDSSDENREVNDTRSRYLDELVDIGILMKGDDNLHQHYAMHDLLHELSQVVSSEECMNTSGCCFRADGIPPSIRHLSINIEGKLNEYYKRELDKLKKRIDVRNLRTLMFFGEYNRGTISTLNEAFKEMKSLRSHLTAVLGDDTEEKLPCSIAADILAEVARRVNAMSAGSFYQLEHLEVDTISGVLVSPICSGLTTTLHTLSFRRDQRVEKFTEEQEQALELLTSLQQLNFEGCYGVQTLPEGLHRLRSLKKLEISKCPAVRSLPDEGLPTSLKELVIADCTEELFVQGKELEARHPGLLVTWE